jgi:PHD/YefM family antitoxin component YafN of YafNO toxin-antitoxin module
MRRSTEKKAPDIIFREGKPVAVILDIDEYQELLEQLEDKHDLKMLEEMRKKPLTFRKLEDFLKEHSSSV